jgi:hypothetical protein
MLHNETFALAMEPSISMNSTSMSWQHVSLPLKSYVVDVDNQAIASCPYGVMLATMMSSLAGDGTVEAMLVVP